MKAIESDGLSVIDIGQFSKEQTCVSGRSSSAGRTSRLRITSCPPRATDSAQGITPDALIGDMPTP